MPATHSAIRASADAIVNTGFGESAAGSGSCTGADASLRNASLGAASRVAEAILEEFPVEAVTVLLKKPRAPIAADFAYVAVEITRRREDAR